MEYIGISSRFITSMHSVASGSEGGQNYISYDIENFKGRKKYQSVALESSFRMIYRLLISDDPVNFKVPSVAEWSKALESDASAGGESPVRAPVRAATLCPYA